MGIRERKNLLISVLRFRGQAAKMKVEEINQFELMYRRARTTEEQDQVTAALRSYNEGWRESDDDFSRLLRIANDFDCFLDEDDEDRLPASLEAAIERARVNVRTT